MILIIEANSEHIEEVDDKIIITNHAAIIFLRQASFAFLISALDSDFLVAKTFLFSAPLDFFIFLFSYFSAFLLGFFLGRMVSLLSLQSGSNLTKDYWLSQTRANPMDLQPPKAVLNPKRTMFLTSHLYLAESNSLSSAKDTLGLPSWKTYKTISFLASNLLTLIFLGLIVMVIN